MNGSRWVGTSAQTLARSSGRTSVAHKDPARKAGSLSEEGPGPWTAEASPLSVHIAGRAGSEPARR